MCNYRHKAPNGVYYFRRAIPEHLHPFFGGKREMKFTLRTKDRDAAKRLILDQWASWSQARLDKAQASFDAAAQPPTAPKSQALLDRERARWEWDEEQADLASEAAQNADEEAEELAPIMDALEAGQVPDAAPQHVARAAQLAIANVRQIYGAELEREANKRNAPGAAVVAEKAVVAPKGNGIFLDTDIVDGWATERSPSAKGRAAYESSARLFNSIMGRKSAELISKADVQAYKQSLIADASRSQVNVRNQLAYLRTLLGWAAQNDVIETDPTKDVRIWVTEKREDRSDWDIDDLAKLFSGPVHSKGERSKGCGGEAAYWLPLLALFMGARREELGQLRVSDVRQSVYLDDAEQPQQAWCMDITDRPDAEGALVNKIKNAASRRLIPLHPKLIELGFVAYVQGLSNQQGRVFPDLKPIGVGQSLTDKWGQWFTRYKRSLGISDNTKVFHSFRHTWKTQATNAGISERLCREIQGHRGKDAADKYGSKPSMATLVAAIASYRIPGLKI
ncbi:site-specific integrase [Sphingopyxis sp. PET50]|uniref:site-specific integrase n=1 Tax=Sphingopyxis sp. PET50 TaxID=2976533 RepID=UPI0021AF68F9|nr:site-specific integrase [Sphingopyxis sp. PET50]